MILYLDSDLKIRGCRSRMRNQKKEMLAELVLTKPRKQVLRKKSKRRRHKLQLHGRAKDPSNDVGPLNVVLPLRADSLLRFFLVSHINVPYRFSQAIKQLQFRFS